MYPPLVEKFRSELHSGLCSAFHAAFHYGLTNKFRNATLIGILPYALTLSSLSTFLRGFFLKTGESGKSRHGSRADSQKGISRGLQEKVCTETRTRLSPKKSPKKISTKRPHASLSSPPEKTPLENLETLLFSRTSHTIVWFFPGSTIFGKKAREDRHTPNPGVHSPANALLTQARQRLPPAGTILQANRSSRARSAHLGWAQPTIPRLRTVPLVCRCAPSGAQNLYGRR